MLEAVLFDLDGTLVDTAPDMAAVANRMLASRGLEPMAPERFRPFVSNGARGMIRVAFGIGTDDPGFAALREEFLATYSENLVVGSALFPGMPELLARLEGEGIPWGVVTNKFERLARPIIAALGLASRCAVLVGGDTCPRPKPFPDPLLHASLQLGIAPMHTLYVGDDIRDIQAARAAGMKSLVAAYGYLGDSPPPSMWAADGIVDSPIAIAGWMGLAANDRLVSVN